ncbi:MULTISPECIES: helix-turn-helix transcriptional regulator [unclassified Methylophaga]|jgi:transcriptional regulator with XRE-family HTH domain|uniref:helix-turn-helix domain-containing protein n=1 Tax=unclassified Methylophaga TaxID=2629249 RepID=UPI00259CBA48|nr:MULTISPECIES: helix-turn-helix transcriptional regulator [unclassified Methylophaga]|tara:strand:- start:2021 stop:2461 length:441 start_codon:yes stop_codon:yes gene_type:complete
MTEKTVTPEKGLGNKKSGEILRLQLVMTKLNLKPIDLAEKTGVSERTIKHSLYDEIPIGAKLLREMNLKLGVSIDWLINGIGSMFCDTSAIGVSEIPAVYNSNDPRMNRIMDAIDNWMAQASEDEKTWLELDIRQRLIKNWPPLGE